MKATTLKKLLIAANIYKDGRFLKDAVVTTKTLHGFTKEMTSLLVEYTRVFPRSLREDYVRKPVLQLNVILGMMGLKVKKVGRSQSDNQSEIFYRLDIQTFEGQKNLSHERKYGIPFDKKVAQAVNEAHMKYGAYREDILIA
ncbi:hypothetical protein [Silvimonas iriomotensis]|uniref:Uncharacterized protein n=1 Tax=Silvimonas iriomotensis TaxID=449662 RepID=A0ABQ2P458_9NEIS|nr:hypothetical protein [Silvimonas iriomotensis]GGP17772.1 hypothetical protein GCM10010970_01470 [Silvimonas iriomotensis]